MPQSDNVKVNPAFPIPDTMKAWVLGGPDELPLVEKPVPVPGAAEVLVRIDGVAMCATDLEIIRTGLPAMIDGGLPFNKNFTPGHEYMGTSWPSGRGSTNSRSVERVTVEVHAGCGHCTRCRQGMYTACHNYGKNYGDSTRATAPTASPPMAASANTRSTTSTRWSPSPTT